MAQTRFERVAFLGWFVADVVLVVVKIVFATEQGKQMRAARFIFVCNVLAVGWNHLVVVCSPNADFANYFGGYTEQFRVTWFSIFDLLNTGGKGHSIEIW